MSRDLQHWSIAAMHQQRFTAPEHHSNASAEIRSIKASQQCISRDSQHQNITAMHQQRFVAPEHHSNASAGIVLVVVGSSSFPFSFQLSGLWFPVSAVEKTGSLQHFSDPPMIVHAGRNGRMVWHVDLPINEWNCRRSKYRMPQMERPGIYGLEGVLVRHVVETDYSSYFILHRAYTNVRVLKLYARERNPSEEIRGKFKARATSLGFPADKIHPMHIIGENPSSSVVPNYS
ncbi:uncharacterized protein [Anolis sagrei]|uniref:uncharacterized protein n=1 Tax=Anolis sagrei TaxID=38937 RepID=UPI00352174B6